jgi:hypothetical protein
MHTVTNILDATVYRYIGYCVNDMTELLHAMSMTLSLKSNGHLTRWLQVAVDSVIVK